jgi:hypothetical protein
VAVLIEAALHFPTVVFTIGLGIALIYWLFVLLGALDIDIGADDAGGGDVDVDGEVGKGDVGGGGVWGGLGLTRVPITISISMILFVCWILSLVASHYAAALLGDASWVAPAILPASLIVGIPISAVLVRPLAGVFSTTEGKSNKDYVGHTCTISTGHVDDGFGQATIEDGGTVLVIPVRCDRAGVLARHHKALIIDFDTDRQAYVVEPATDMLPASREGSGES